MLARFVFVVPLSDLLFHLLADQVDGGVEVAFDILGIQVRAAQAQPNRTAKLFLRSARVIVIQRDARVDGEAVQMLQLGDSTDEVIFDGFGQRHVMRRKDQVHGDIMHRPCIKASETEWNFQTPNPDPPQTFSPKPTADSASVLGAWCPLELGICGLELFTRLARLKT